MNYCEHHLGDYAKRARAFTLIEHGCYAVLRDRYFDTEEPIPDADVYRQACARTGAERAAVDVVLAEFYRLDGDVWRCDAFDAQITRVKAKIKAAQENGKAGGRPKQTQQKPSGLADGKPDESKPKALQTPDTKPSYSVPNGTGALAPPDPADVIFGLGIPLLTAAGVSDRNARSMLGLQRKQHGDPAVIDALRRCALEKPIQPVPWLQAALKARPTPNKRQAIEVENHEIAQRWANGAMQ